MSYKINYLDKKVIVTYGKNVDKNDMKYAFFEITELGDFKKLDYIIYDFTNINSFKSPPIPDNIIDAAKTVSQFAISWNSHLKIITIATDSGIRSIFSELIKNNQDLIIWELFLFNNWEETREWNQNL